MRRGEHTTAEALDRVAGAPISWGVCEVPGWGAQLEPGRVLAEMASLGLRATELGPDGWLPAEPGALRAFLDRHGLGLVGGFVPLVLHESGFDDVRAAAERRARLLAAAGAQVFVAAVVMDDSWSAPVALDGRGWATMIDNLRRVEDLASAHGLRFGVHPHVGTLLESAADVDRLLGSCDVGLCFDSGHMLIGGTDPADFVREHASRIAHVHLKDVDAAVAARLRAGDLALMQAVQAGLFRPLGRGDAGIGEVVALLDAAGYEGLLVLEQDTAITGAEPPVGSGPIIDVQASIEFILTTLAPQTQEETRV